MEKVKAILIIHPMVSPMASHLSWSTSGYKTIAFYLPTNELVEYITKGVAATNFDVKITATEDFEQDLKLIREHQAQYDIVYGYIGAESAIPYGEKLLRKLFPQQSNDPATSGWRFSKYEMNERLMECGLPYIKQCRIVEKQITPAIEKFLQEVPYPLVVKPSFNSAASEGVYFCNTAAEVYACINNISEKGYFGRVSEIIIQEKVIGAEYLVDSFSYAAEHKMSTAFSYEKYVIKNTPVYTALNQVDNNDVIIRQLFAVVKKILTALGVEFGFAHTEIMVTPDNEIKLIELNLRPSGLAGAINEVTYAATRIDQYTLAAAALAKKELVSENDNKKHSLFFINNVGFTYKRLKVELINSLASYQDIKVFKPTCDKIPEKHSLAESVALVHLANATAAGLQADKDILKNYEEVGTLFEQ
jgi:biotin carboxylase